MASRHRKHSPWTVPVASVLMLVLVLGILAGQPGAPLIASQEGLGTWTEMSIPGLNAGNRVYAVRRANNLLLAGTQLQGMFRSTNGGSSWQHVPQYAQSQVRDMLLVGAGSQVALAATWGDGLLRSTDNGGTWSRVGQNINTVYLYSLASKSGTIYVGTGTSGIWKSTNNGGTWSATGTISSPGAVSLAAATEQIVYAGSVNNGLYKTTNGGGTWNQIGFAGKTIRAVAVEPGSPDRVYASVIGEGVSRSTDGGGNWQPLSGGLPDLNVLSLLVTDVSGNRQVLAGTSTNGVYRLASNTWQAWGLPGKEVPSLSDWNDRVYAGTNQGVWEYAFQPTPTPPPTPTPGLKTLNLGNEPDTSVGAGEEIEYTIHYVNGRFELTNFELRNLMPINVEYVDGSAIPVAIVTNRELQWSLPNLNPDEAGDVSYRVVVSDVIPARSAVVVFNMGANASWKHNGQSGEMASNPVTNPASSSEKLWLPLIYRVPPDPESK